MKDEKNERSEMMEKKRKERKRKEAGKWIHSELRVNWLIEKRSPFTCMVGIII